MSVNCCHCFKEIGDQTPHIKCDGCSLKVHKHCLNLTKDELAFISKTHSPSIKLFCNPCNVTLTAVSEIKVLVNEMKESFDNRLAKLETLIRENSKVQDREEVIDESVERSIRACNVVLYNVKESSEDASVVNDLLEVIDVSLVVTPENVLRLGKRNENKPRPIKLRFKNTDMARLCLRKQSALLGNATFSGVVVRDDKTPRQRQYLNALRDELQRRTDNGETNLTIKYINHVPKITIKQKN